MNYRKMKKMIMGDPVGELNEEGDSSIAETEDYDDKSEAVRFLIVAVFFWIISECFCYCPPQLEIQYHLWNMHIAEHFTKELLTIYVFVII